jgi:hypothetical protein
MLQSADVSAANWKTWLVTIALTLIAFIAGHGPSRRFAMLGAAFSCLGAVTWRLTAPAWA